MQPGRGLCKQGGPCPESQKREGMIWKLLEGQDVTPKYLVNGCPKHGLHLLAMMVEGSHVSPMPGSIFTDRNWTGTFRDFSFGLRWQDMERWCFIMSRLQQGFYYRGHVGYREDISEFMRLGRVAHVFIYRDLRDVAVSHAFHVLRKEPGRFNHIAKPMYWAMEQAGGFDAVLSAVIEGLGPFPGTVKLWEAYAPWLDQDWVHAVRFEDAIDDLKGAAAGILEYGMDQITRGIWEDRLSVEGSLFEQSVECMANSAARKQMSPTYRHGVAGDWREYFKDEHRALFKETGGGEWLMRLGYEQDEDW